MPVQTDPTRGKIRWSTPQPRPSAGTHARPYRRRRPETTTLHRIVREHLETYLALANEADPMGDGVPDHVEKEFRSYLKCGILAHGFARARCSGCGYEFLLAFSCKARGACPSCGAKRMAQTAAHLVDHVFPHVPVRQFVLSVPKRLRPFLHHRSRTATAVLHILLRALQATLREACPTAPANRLHGRGQLPPRVRMSKCKIRLVLTTDRYTSWWIRHRFRRTRKEMAAARREERKS